MKQFLSIASWVLLTAGLVVVLGFVNQVQNKKVCTEIDIEIDNSNGNFFVEEQDIFAMVYHEMDTVVGRPISIPIE